MKNIRFYGCALLALLMLVPVKMRADEGMWLPALIQQRIIDMQSKGFKLSAEDIYSVNKASLKDAVVLFGGGCTGELISPKGLLITNHHCGYGQIQKHSSVDHDYLKDGFWAMSMSEELPNKGLSVSFLDRMEDVTSAVLAGFKDGMTEQQRDSIIELNSKRLIEAVKGEGKGMRANVEALFYGNQYFLFAFRTFKDVRLVGAPPSSIGKFGGDTDNWMWPRHTGDFSIFRIYADANNDPAEYSEDNVPYSPKRFLRISTKGVNEGDFTFVYGFPGSTREYVTSDAVRYIEELSDPHKIKLRTMRLDAQREYMSQSQMVRIMYSSKNASTSNAWKKWQGEVKGLKKMKVVAAKLEYERRFREWAKGGEYDGILDSLSAAYKELEGYAFARDYYVETIGSIELMRFASSVESLLEKKMDVTSVVDPFFKDYYLPIDKKVFISMMTEFDKCVEAKFKPEYFTDGLAKYGSVEAWADYIYTNSVFTEKDKLLDFIALHTENGAKGEANEAAVHKSVGKHECMSEGKSVVKSEAKHEDKPDLKSDPALEFAEAFAMLRKSQIDPLYLELNKKISLFYRDYMRGQMAFENDRIFYPDANLTLRVAYGNVKGYRPKDGVYYYHSSSLEGIMQKDNPNIFDYNIPQKLRDVYAAKDYGKWGVVVNGGKSMGETGKCTVEVKAGKSMGEIDNSGLTLTVPVCFVATNHTTGGNSGSPVLNANGELLGLNFDRVWEGTMSDIVYDPDVCRNITLDIRYALFIIDKIGGASHLFDEMVFAE